jgi:hypothetical protein
MNYLNEEWRMYPKLKGRFSVSTYGRIISLATGRLIKTSLDKYGYERLCINVGSRTDGSRHHLNLKVHQMVAETFISPQPEKGYSVDHLDHNPRNNRVENLEWVTRSENIKRAWRDGLCDFMYGNHFSRDYYLRKHALERNDTI